MQTVIKFVAQFGVFQQQKYITAFPAELFQLLKILRAILENMGMYFIIGLQQSNVYDSIMVVVNRLSKYGLFEVLCNTFSAQTVVFFLLRL